MPCRIGSIRFINSLPIDWGILSGAVPFGGRIEQDVPSGLNEKILKDRLDVSAVSFFWYAKHESEFVLLPDLCISSESGAQSVLLFSREPFGRLNEKTRIVVTAQGRTTPVLLEILCRKKYGFKPHLVYHEKILDGIPQGADAAMLIGDEALLTAEKFRSSDLLVTDLAEEWQKWTGLPIVFAVWAVRRDFWRRHSSEVASTHEALLASRKWGAQHSDAVVQEAARRTALPAGVLRSYFQALSYKLDERMVEGTRRYAELARACGLLETVPRWVFAKTLDARLVESVS